MLEVQIFPLVSRVALPVAAPAATRSHVPPGYGAQEHCLPFTAAAALGFLIKSPISFGLCALSEVPPDGHSFRSHYCRRSRGPSNIFTPSLSPPSFENISSTRLFGA